MRISLCMIVKDEQDLLPACLASVQGVVDEIVVVDTGSSDDTVRIAESHGAKVLRQEWTGDFSVARNLALEQASGDWILVLDADERLLPLSAKELRLTLESTSAEAVRVHVRDRVGEGENVGYLINLSTRLFRNRPEYRYSRRVHEQIEPSIARANVGPPPQNSNLVVEHLGYLPAVISRKQKRQRNLQLLQADAEHVGDGFSFYNLGVEYTRHGRRQEALLSLCKAVEMLDSRLLVAAEAVHRKAICLMEMESYDLALDCLAQGIRRYPDFTDLVYHKGEVLAQLRRYREAVDAFETCRRMGETNVGYYSLVGVGGYRAAYAIGLVYQELRNFPLAIRWYRLSLAEHTSYIPAVNRIAEVLRAVLPAEEVAARLSEYFDLQQSESRMAYLRVLLSVGCYPAAKRLCEQLLGEHSNVAGLLSAATVSAFHCGCFEQCIQWATQLAESSESMVEPLLMAMVSHWVRGELPLAQSVVSRLGGRGEAMLQAVCQQMQWYAEGRTDFSLSVDFSDAGEQAAFHTSSLQVLRLVVISGQRGLLAKVLPVLSPLQGLDAWLQLGLYYAQYGLDDLAWAELRDCEQRGQTSTAALMTLGKLAASRKLPSLAVDYLRRVLDDAPDNIEARQLLTTCCRQLAEQILLDGISRFPDARILVEELARLRKEVTPHADQPGQTARHTG